MVAMGSVTMVSTAVSVVTVGATIAMVASAVSIRMISATVPMVAVRSVTALPVMTAVITMT